jgi:hypothetical protein
MKKKWKKERNRVTENVEEKKQSEIDERRKNFYLEHSYKFSFLELRYSIEITRIQRAHCKH